MARTPASRPPRFRPKLVERSVEEIVRLEGRDRVDRGPTDLLADVVTAFSGSMLFVWLHAAWFAAWIAFNAPGIGVARFDPFPFGFLTMVVSLEAIFLSTFVLISQNRQAVQADRRAKVDLQVNMIAEQEVTKLMELVGEIHERLGLRDGHDPVLQEMKQPTHVRELADAVDAAGEEADPERAKGPDTAGSKA